MRLTNLVLVAAVRGCGGGGTSRPSLDGSKTLGTLTPAELSELCAYGASVEMGPRDVMCGDATLHLKSQAQCEAVPAPTTCQATVTQAEDCIDAIGADPCNFGTACAPLLSC
jgi:hypothetical protein